MFVYFIPAKVRKKRASRRVSEWVSMHVACLLLESKFVTTADCRPFNFAQGRLSTED